MASRLLIVALAAFSHASAHAQDPDPVWTRDLQHAGAFGEVEAVFPRAGGEVLVVTRVEQFAWDLLRLDDQGNVLSQVPLESSPAGLLVWGACEDGAGGLYLGGQVFAGSPLGGPGLGGEDGFLGRYDAQGNRIWFRRFGTSRPDHLHDVAADGSGGVVAAGNTFDTSFGGPLPVAEGWFVRYDANGVEVWSTRAGDPAIPETIELWGLTRTSTGRFVGVGSRGVTGIWPVHAAVAVVAADGTLLSLDASSLPDVRFWAACSDDAGGYYAAGRNLAAGGALVARRGPGHSWLTAVGTGPHPNGFGFLYDLLPDPQGGVLLAGSVWAYLQPNHVQSRYLARLDGTGSLTWEWVVEPSTTVLTGANALAFDPNGDLYAGGFGPGFFSWIARLALDPVAQPGCTGELNSTGGAAHTQAVGSPLLPTNAVTLYAGGLPPGRATLFLASLSTGFLPGVGGSSGTLCLGGSIGRFVGPGQLQVSDASGLAHLALDATAVPQPTGSTAVLAGEPWYFQAWYRDANPGPTSNFTGSCELVLQ